MRTAKRAPRDALRTAAAKHKASPSDLWATPHGRRACAVAAWVAIRGGVVSWTALGDEFIDRRGWCPDEFYKAASNAQRAQLLSLDSQSARRVYSSRRVAA